VAERVESLDHGEPAAEIERPRYEARAGRDVLLGDAPFLHDLLGEAHGAKNHGHIGAPGGGRRRVAGAG